MRPGSLHPRAYKMPSTSPIVLSGHYCCGGHCGLDCKRPWVNILGVKSSVRSPPRAVRPPPALPTTGGRGSPGRWVTGEPAGGGGHGGVGHGGPPGSRDGEPRGSTGGEDSGQPVVGRASPRRGTTGNPGRGQRGCPRDEAHGALRDGGTTGDPAARVATREDPGTGDDRGARDGGSLGELGTVGDPGEPRARIPNRRARDGGQVGSRDGDTRGRAGRGGNHSDRPHRPHGRLRNVEAGGVRRHDRRGRLHHISPMSDTPFWSFVML